MIRHTRLRIIVRPDLRGTVTSRHHCLALRSNTVKILLMLHIVKTSTQLLQRPVQILQLGPLLLALDHDTRRDMRQAHRRIRRVHALSART